MLPLVLWANTTLGLTPSLLVDRVPSAAGPRNSHDHAVAPLTVLDPRTLTSKKQIAQAEEHLRAVQGKDVSAGQRGLSGRHPKGS